MGSHDKLRSFALQAKERWGKLTKEPDANRTRYRANEREKGIPARETSDKQSATRGEGGRRKADAGD